MRGYTPSLEARGPSRGEVSEAVRRAIERTVVLREGRRRGVTLPAGALEEEVMRFRADFPPGGLEKALLQAGMEPDAWRELLRRSLLYRRSADAIAAAGATVTPQEVEEAFRKERNPSTVPERIRVRQYLFDSAERAAAAREKLLAGRPAGREDGDPSVEGVDLGFFRRDELPPELPAGVFDLPEGGVSEPVSGEGVTSLFQVTRREAARAQTLGQRRGADPGGDPRSPAGGGVPPVAGAGDRGGEGKGPHGSAATTDRGETMTRTVAIIAAAGAALLLSAGAAFPRVIDGVVALVNEEPITFSEVRESVSEGMGIPVGDADALLREQRDPRAVLRWIEALVDSVLVRKELEKLGQPIDGGGDRQGGRIRPEGERDERGAVRRAAREGGDLPSRVPPPPPVADGARCDRPGAEVQGGHGDGKRGARLLPGERGTVPGGRAGPARDALLPDRPRARRRGKTRRRQGSPCSRRPRRSGPDAPSPRRRRWFAERFPMSSSTPPTS